MAKLRKDAVLIPIAKIYFMVMGYVMQLLMGHFLTKSQIGIFHYINSIISPINMVMVQGGIQTTSHFIARRDQDRRRFWPILLMFFLISLVIFLLVQIAAPWLSVWLMKGRQYTPFLRIGSVIFLTYGIYAVFIGYLNGSRQFKRQAFFDMGFSTLKIVMIFGMLLSGLGVYGLIGGWAIAACFIMCIAFFIVKDSSKDQKIIPWKKVGRYALPILGYQAVFYCLLNIDTWILGGLSSSGEVLENGGNYLSITVLAKIPFQVILSLTFILFPLIAKSSLKDQSAESAGYIIRSIRYALMLALPFVAVLIARPEFFLQLIYGGAFIQNSLELRILTPGMVMLALFVLCNTVIVATGTPKIAFILTSITLGISGGLNLILIPQIGITGAAIASAIAFSLGFMIGWLYLKRIYQIQFPLKTVVRVCLIIALGYGLFQLIPALSMIVIFLFLGIWGVITYLLLWGLGEFKQDEIQWLKGVLRRKSSIK